MSTLKAPEWREPYSLSEDKKILEYIIKKGLFNRVKGKALWEGMALAMCVKGQGRSWHSLKERYVKHIIPNLINYNLRPDLNCRLQEPFKWAGRSLETSSRGKVKRSFKVGARDAYSTADDELIIDNVLKTKGKLKGNTLWKKLESKGILEDRSWQSLRSRFLNHIFENLDSLTDVDTADLLKERMKARRNAGTNESSSDEETRQVSKPRTLIKKKRGLLPLQPQSVFKSPPIRDTPQRMEARRTSQATTSRSMGSIAPFDHPIKATTSTPMTKPNDDTDSSSSFSSGSSSSGSQHAEPPGEESRRTTERLMTEPKRKSRAEGSTVKLSVENRRSSTSSSSSSGPSRSQHSAPPSKNPRHATDRQQTESKGKSRAEGSPVKLSVENRRSSTSSSSSFGSSTSGSQHSAPPSKKSSHATDRQQTESKRKSCAEGSLLTLFVDRPGSSNCSSGLKALSSQTSTDSTFFEEPVKDSAGFGEPVKASTECSCGDFEENPIDVVPCGSSCKSLLSDMPKSCECKENCQCCDLQTEEAISSFDEEDDTFIDPLFAYFIKNNVPPYVVMDGVKVCLGTLSFPVHTPFLF